MDEADEFAAQQSKRERAILLNVAIDQNKSVGDLLQAICAMRGISIFGKV